MRISYVLLWVALSGTLCAQPTNLPTGSQFWATMGRSGPFAVSGNVYVVARNGDPSIEVYKSTDVSSSFAAQDAANNPTEGGTSIWAVLDGSALKIISQETADRDVFYHEFSTSSDTWTTVDQSVDTGPDTNNQVGASLVVRSNGDRIAFYNSTEKIKGTSYHRVVYAKYTTSWGSPVAVDDGGEIRYRHAAIALGASDKVHFFYKEDTNDVLKHKSLTSGDTLSAVEDVSDTTVEIDTQNVGVLPAVYYDDGGVERVTVLWRKESNDHLMSSEIDDDGVPGAEEQATDNVAHPLASMPTACLAIWNKQVQLLYSDNSTNDLFRDINDDSAGWGTDTEPEDAITAQRLSCNVITRAGTRLAWVRAASSTGILTYNELLLEAAAAGGPFVLTTFFD